MSPQLQEAHVLLDAISDSVLSYQLSTKWRYMEEWYVFFENPRSKEFNIVYTIEEDKINPNGNTLWMKDMYFGMGKDHPVAWYKATGKGRTLYTSMGHDTNAWKQEGFITFLENALR